MVYQFAWQKWCSWSHSREVDSLAAPLVEVLNFLTSPLHVGSEYRTLGCYCSVLSMTFTPVEGVGVGQHPMVSHPLKGVYHIHPPEPRSFSTWNVQAVLKFISVHPSLSAEHSPKAITLGLAMLLALTSARRRSGIQLDVTFMTISDEEITFAIPTLTKNQREGDATKEFSFAAYPIHPPWSYAEGKGDSSRYGYFK